VWLSLQRGLGRRDEQSRFAWLRHPLRIVATGLALGCLVWPLTNGIGVGSVFFGTILGVVLGELAGKSRYRGWVLAASASALLGALQGLLSLAVRVEWFSAAVGPTFALAVVQAARFLVWSALPVAALRALAVRVRSAVFVELALSVAGTAFLFAAHRGGNVSRPFWLGDWAYRVGLEPSVVLLGVGSVAFLVMATVLAAEHGRRTNLLTLVVLPLVAWFVFTSTDVQHLAQLPRDSERDHPITAHGEPPRNPTTGEKNDTSQGKPDKDPDSKDGGQGKPDKDPDPKDGGQGKPDKDPDPKDGGQGESDKDPDPKDGGQGESDKDPDPKDGGQGEPNDEPSDGGSPPPPEEPPPLDAPPPPDSPQNQQPMAIVLLGDDYDPPAQMFYFRQESWSQFAGNRLVATTRPDADRDVPSEFPTQRQDVLDPPPATARKRIQATVAMVLAHKKPFALETPVTMDVAANPDPKRFARAYRFEALAQRASYAELLGAKAGNPSWTEELRAYYTQSAQDPRFEALAKEIVGKLDAKKRDVPLFKALAIKVWMDQNLTYSTSHRHADVSDPAADFLFGDRIGYCVHFAHVAVFLWRSLGLPARVGMGYAVNAESREGSAVMVKSGDGHAWPELYLDGAGWVVLDIAPKKNLDPPARPADKELQRKMAELARKKPPEPPKQAPKTPSLTPKRKLPWRAIFLATLAASVVFFYLVKWWRRLAPRLVGPSAIARIGYRAAVDVLSEFGVVRHEGETREAFGRRLAEEFPSFARMTDWHVADHFGDPARSANERPERDVAMWRASLSTFRAECRPRRRTARAWLGILNPASFLSSK
jgi:transglutaminase-like putative cysteine protease